MDFLLTLLIPAALLIVLILGTQPDKEGMFFFNKDYTRVFKGACCIIVILVHVPAEHGNVLQDAMGSFGYVAVTLFFMFSAYGMYYSKLRKKDYLSYFWRNRLTSLLIPMFLINVVEYFYNLIAVGKNAPSLLVNLNGWVWVLLQFCILFFVIELGEYFKLYKEKTSKFLLVLGVVGSSLFLYFYNGGMRGNSSELGWCFERLGLVWGLLLVWNFSLVKRWLSPKLIKTVISILLCLILGIVYLKFKHVFFWGEYLSKIVLGVAIIYLLFLITSRRQWGNRASFFLGDISYEVYLSHGFIMSLVAKYLHFLSSGEFILTSVTLTIIFSWLIHVVDKRIVQMLRH